MIQWKNAMQNMEWINPSLPYKGAYIRGRSMVCWDGKRMPYQNLSFMERLRHGTLLQKKELYKSVSCSHERIVWV